MFEEVAHLSIPDADPEQLATHLRALRGRTAEARGTTRDPKQSDRLVHVDWALQDVDALLDTARGGDTDAAQKARRLLIDAEAVLSEVEESAAWPELEDRALGQLATASRWVSELGTVQEQRMLQEASTAVERARAARSATDLQRYLGVARQLTNAAYYRHPEVWRWGFESAASDVSRSTDLVRTQQLVTEGRAALAADDRDGLRRITQDLWRLLPDDPRDLTRGSGSGLW